MAKLGRPFKGDRKVIVTRAHTDLAALVEQARRDQGFQFVSDYVANVLARELGRDDLAPLPTAKKNDQELPIAS